VIESGSIDHALELATTRLAGFLLGPHPLRPGRGAFSAWGGLSARNYSTITGASPATTTRDLVDLVELGALLRNGERKYARYRLNLPLRPVPRVLVDPHGDLVES